MAGGRGFRYAEAALAVALVALGALIAVETARLPVAATYARIGPRLFPGLVAGGLVLAGLAMLYEARATLAAALPRLDASPLGLVTAGLVAQMVLLQPLGFVLASSVMFVAVAAAFGSSRLVLNAAVALVLTSVVYVAFTRGLGLHLPPGILGAWW